MGSGAGVAVSDTEAVAAGVALGCATEVAVTVPVAAGVAVGSGVTADGVIVAAPVTTGVASAASVPSGVGVGETTGTGVAGGATVGVGIGDGVGVTDGGISANAGTGVGGRPGSGSGGACTNCGGRVGADPSRWQPTTTPPTSSNTQRLNAFNCRTPYPPSKYSQMMRARSAWSPGDHRLGAPRTPQRLLYYVQPDHLRPCCKKLSCDWPRHPCADA